MITKFKAVVAKLKKPATDIVATLTPQKADILHMTIGLVGEVGELRAAVYNADLTNVVEELGDLEFYYEGLCTALGFEAINVKFEEKDPINYLITDSYELLDSVKKYVVYNKDSALTPVKANLQCVRSELNDLYRLFGLERDYVLNQNIKKLMQRYSSGGYSDKQAQERRDKQV